MGCSGALENENKISKIINNSDNTTYNLRKILFSPNVKIGQEMFKLQNQFSVPILKSPSRVDGKVLQVTYQKEPWIEKSEIIFYGFVMSFDEL